MEINRGEIFYIRRGGATTGSEIHPERPAVVISNKENNENSDIVEIVYMTLKPKKDLPTHVKIKATGKLSTVLCEQVSTVSTERLGEFVGKCTDEEMKDIDVALMISLQLDDIVMQVKRDKETIEMQRKELTDLRKELANKEAKIRKMEENQYLHTIRADDGTGTYEIDAVTNGTTGVIAGMRHAQKDNRLVKAEAERDTYKGMYEQLISKLVKGGIA